MLPTLFDWGPIHLYSYGLMFAVGVLLAIFYLSRQTPPAGLGKNQVIDLILVLTFLGVVGGRLFYVAQHWDYFLENPAEIPAVWQGGLVIYGGMIGALAGLAIFCVVRKINFFLLTDLYFPAVALAQAFGRIGCFLNGCCWGTTSQLAWSVQFPFLKEPVHPTQIYSSLFDFALFLFLAHQYPRRSFAGEITLLYLGVYGLGRFVIEYFRGDNLPVWLGMTQAQIVSGAFVISAVLLYLLYFRNYEDRKNIRS